jgi:hypothetical protein
MPIPSPQRPRHHHHHHHHDDDDDHDDDDHDHDGPRPPQLPAWETTRGKNSNANARQQLGMATHGNAWQWQAFQQMWMTKAEYDERGPAIVHQHCF